MKKRKTKATLNKEKKLEQLINLLSENPYFNDKQIAQALAVSIPCVRNYRGELGIKEVRERIKNTVKALAPEEVVGTIVDLELNKGCTAKFQTSAEMVFKKTNMVRGQYLYSFAESVAFAVMDAEAALTGVANIKYKEPVYANSTLVAKAELTQIRLNKHFIWVFVYCNKKEVFRAKFIMVAVS